MVTIGRYNNRSRMTPSNQGLAKRIDTKLDAVVDSYAAKFKTALAVDGVVSFIYNKHRGNVACTCRGFQNLNNYASHEIGITGRETQTGAIRLLGDGNTRIAETTSPKVNSVTQVSSLSGGLALDNLFKQNSETIVQKIENDLGDDGFTEDSSEDVLDALFADQVSPVYSGDGDPMKQLLSATAMSNSTDLPYSSGMVACPICYGAGTVDSWRLYNGDRVVLDASAMYQLDIFNDVEIDTTSQPAVYSVFERSYLQWSNVPIPTSWRHLMRLSVFNRGQELDISTYNLYFIHPSQPTVRNPINYNILSQLNNSALLQQGIKLSFVLESNLGQDEPLVFTHIEMIFSTGDIVFCQVPELDLPNEDEFIDYNLNTTFEFPVDVEIRENSFIIDGKYRRVWKVTSSNRKLTAQGKSFGYSIGLRALHSFERQYALLNVLTKPRDPFLNNQLPRSDEDY